MCERASKIDTSKEKICHILLTSFYFDKGKNASQVVENLNSVYGPDIGTVNHAEFWFRRFRSGNFDIKDAPRTRRPIMENVESDRHVITISIAQELKVAQKTLWNHSDKVGDKKKFNVWVPHELTQNNLIDWISICELLLKQNLPIPEVVGDLWWKADHLEQFRVKTVVVESWWAGWNSGQVRIDGLESFAFWWDWQGIIYYELLLYGKTLNSELYCQQFHMKGVIAQKHAALANRRGIVFHQDNARPQTSSDLP